MSGCQSVWTGFFWFWQYVHVFSHKRTMEEVKVPFPLSNWHWHCLVSQFSVGICYMSGAISFTKLGENFLYRWGTHILGRGYLSWNAIEGGGWRIWCLKGIRLPNFQKIVQNCWSLLKHNGIIIQTPTDILQYTIQQTLKYTHPPMQTHDTCHVLSSWAHPPGKRVAKCDEARLFKHI